MTNKQRRILEDAEISSELMHEVDHYLKDVGAVLSGTIHEKENYLTMLCNDIAEFVDVNPSASINNIIGEFGTPEKHADVFLENKMKDKPETIFEDGSYVVDLIEASPILVRGSVYTRTGSKTRTFYDSDNVVKWKFIVYGTFEVNSGVSAKCTKATCNTEIYDSNWKVISQSAWPSGNQAIGTATLKRYLLGIPVRTEEVTVTLTCDKNGTLS